MDREYRKSKGFPNAEDFRSWEERAETLTDAELNHAIRDAFAAAKAAGLDPVSGWYSDEGSTYLSEQRKRRKKAGKPPTEKEARIDSRALDAIAEAMSGMTWDADTLDYIAARVRETGRKIEEVE